MPKIVEVVPGHPLSRTHTFSQRLAVNNICITSVQQGFHYIKLLHHGQTAAAEQLLTDVAMQWNPERIQQWSKKQITHENVNFVAHSGDVMKAILVHQIRNPSNPLYQALEEAMEGAGNPCDIEFRVYSPHLETVFSSGYRHGEWKGYDNMPGFDIYAGILRDLVSIVQGDQPKDNPLFDELLTNFTMFNPKIPRSVLLISDSQCRLMNEIQAGGDAIPVSGGADENTTVPYLDPESDFCQAQYAKDRNDEEGMSKGMQILLIVLIVTAVIVAIICIYLIICLPRQWKKRARRMAEEEELERNVAAVDSNGKEQKEDKIGKPGDAKKEKRGKDVKVAGKGAGIVKSNSSAAISAAGPLSKSKSIEKASISLDKAMGGSLDNTQSSSYRSITERSKVESSKIKFDVWESAGKPAPKVQPQTHAQGTAQGQSRGISLGVKASLEGIKMPGQSGADPKMSPKMESLEKDRNSPLSIPISSKRKPIGPAVGKQESERSDGQSSGKSEAQKSAAE